MLRKSKNKQNVDIDDEWARELPADSTPSIDPLEYTSLEELRDNIEETFARMSEKQSIVVRLHDMEGHTIRGDRRDRGVPGRHDQVPALLWETGIQGHLQRASERQGGAEADHPVANLRRRLGAAFTDILRPQSPAPRRHTEFARLGGYGAMSTAAASSRRTPNCAPAW